MAKLCFRWGPMNCGKTTALLQVAHNYDEIKENVIIIKPAIDSKGEDTIVSRIGISRKVDILIKKDESIIDYVCGFDKKPACILVDEAQFLAEKQVKELQLVAKFADIVVICYGLRTSFQNKLFEGSAALLALSDEIEEIVRACACKKKAKFNARLENGKYVLDGSEVLIDGATPNIEYVSLCASCYIKKVLIPNNGLTDKEKGFILRDYELKNLENNEIDYDNSLLDFLPESEKVKTLVKGTNYKNI